LKYKAYDVKAPAIECIGSRDDRRIMTL